jgi:hypothetical protein
LGENEAFEPQAWAVLARNDDFGRKQRPLTGIDEQTMIAQIYHDNVYQNAYP